MNEVTTVKVSNTALALDQMFDMIFEQEEVSKFIYRKLLVLTQLSGGNDGINTVIPLDQYIAYQNARSNIAIPENKILRLNGFDTVGLHPALTEIPDPLAIQVGSMVSTTFQGPTFTMGLAISNPANFYNLIEGKVNIDSPTRLGEQLSYIEDMAQKTDQYSMIIKQAALKVLRQSDKCPEQGKNPLAYQLKVVARLIPGGLKTKVYMVNTGGFDTHAKQIDYAGKTIGTHANLLKRVSEAINVFMDDLTYLGIGDMVMGMTFSEFGRRIKSNASRGTDHGVAAPLFYFGHNIKITFLE